MSVRTETIATIFAAWLRRYSPPNIMKNDADVMKAERDALLRVLLKFAPQSDYDGWVNRALDKLEYQMKTRAWPTKGELGSVCSNLRKDAFVTADVPSVAQRSSLDINADRMNRGEPVGDGYFYGRNAVELVKSGKVSRDIIQKYRSAFFFSMKDVWGEEKARQVEAQYIAKHDAAEKLSQAKVKTPEGEPFKRMPLSSLDHLEAAE